jgi:hypothetical protein
MTNPTAILTALRKQLDNADAQYRAAARTMNDYSQPASKRDAAMTAASRWSAVCSALESAISAVPVQS